MSEKTRTWQDATWDLADEQSLSVCQHTETGRVSLSLPGYMTDGRGFSIYFSPAHLPTLREVCQALEIQRQITRQYDAL